MKPTKMTFQRLEKKYVLSKTKYDAFIKDIKPYIMFDEFGPSTICNIYFDTEHYDLITTSLQKPPYKEKLRLRSYGVPQMDSIVYLEIKKKCLGVVNKRRIALSLQDVLQYIEKDKHPESSTQIVSEIDYFLKFYKPTPKVFLAYDREPYVSKDDLELRLTFDHHIRRRYDHVELAYGDEGEDILPSDEVVLEIKAVHAYPLWLTKLLSKHKVYPSSFSKYGVVFMEDIVKKERLLCSQV